jgi:hypothetical protein
MVDEAADTSGVQPPEGPEAAGSPPSLLLSALDALPQDQRRMVLQWLFERIPGATPPVELTGEWRPAEDAFTVHRQRRRAERESAERESAELLLRVSDQLRGDYQMVPVRLPTADHARLRAWSQEHGFSMATVIRGLLSRFLDEHRPGPGPVAPSPATD